MLFRDRFIGSFSIFDQMRDIGKIVVAEGVQNGLAYFVAFLQVLNLAVLGLSFLV